MPWSPRRTSLAQGDTYSLHPTTNQVSLLHAAPTVVLTGEWCEIAGLCQDTPWEPWLPDSLIPRVPALQGSQYPPAGWASRKRSCCSLSFCFKRQKAAGCWWLTPVILATQEAAIRRIVVRSQPRQIVCETLSQKYLIQKGLVDWLKV
jgi:hypothetical protein